MNWADELAVPVPAGRDRKGAQNMTSAAPPSRARMSRIGQALAAGATQDEAAAVGWRVGPDDPAVAEPVGVRGPGGSRARGLRRGYAARLRRLPVGRAGVDSGPAPGCRRGLPQPRLCRWIFRNEMWPRAPADEVSGERNEGTHSKHYRG